MLGVRCLWTFQVVVSSNLESENPRKDRGHGVNRPPRRELGAKGGSGNLKIWDKGDVLRTLCREVSESNVSPCLEEPHDCFMPRDRG